MKLIVFEFFLAAALIAVASANTCKKGLEYDAELGKCRDAFTVCPSKFYTNPKGVISKGQEYFNTFINLDCQYTIQVAPNRKIQLHLDDFFSELSANYITIYDGSYASNLVIATCSEANKETCLNSDITSSGNALTIVSHTSTSESIFSWHASYSTLSVNSNLNLVANNGVITSTNFSTNYDSSENQLNIISADQPIILTFDILQIPENDYTLFVYDGRTRYSPKLLSLTGQKTSVPLTITSTGTIVSIYFFPTKTDVKYKGWQISWTPQLVANLGTGGSSTPVPSSTTTDILSSTTTAYRLNSCPSSLYNKPTGILTSTNYPQNYLNYLDCYYQINAAVGERILLTINDFVTQSGYDYLQIYGERTSLKRLTGRLTNLGQSYNFVSASNYMGLQFHSDSSIVAKGWSATYISKSFPSVQYINTTTGSLTNLNLPQNFANNTDYSYIIRVPMYSQINLQISNFECVGTVLTIFDGPLKQSLILGTLTGNAVYSSPIEYSSNYNYLSFSIKQVSGSIDNCALSLSWNTQKISGLCGTASFTQPKGIISSPGFDGNYPNNVNCVMQITVPQTKRISITMDSFITEQNSDYLAIYDGEDTNFPLIGKYTGDLSSQLSSLSFTSYKNVLTLVFYSDYAINAQGWQLHYETIDATKSITYYTNEGRINSNNFPLNYNVHDTEVYVIQNLYGYPIDFTVDSFSLASGSSLAFYDGGIQNRNLISSLSGSQTSPTIVTTSTSQVLVYFAAQSNDVSRGFSFTWNTTDADPTCPRKLYQDRFGEITSPNYPNAYSNNQDCYYYIIVEPGKRIELDFIAFNTESGFDILSIYDGPDTTSTPFYTSSGILQRSSPSAQIKSSSNVMTLWFHSDRSNVATGFSGFYNELDSSNIVKFGGINGILASANYPNNYNTYADEHYLISIPEKQSMNITFTEISLQSAYTTLTLYDGPSESYPLLATYSGHVILNSANATLYATQNMVTVVFKSEYPLSDRGFSLGWTS